MYSIQLPSPDSKLHTLYSLKSGGSSGRGYTCPTGLLSSLFGRIETCHSHGMRFGNTVFDLITTYVKSL